MKRRTVLEALAALPAAGLLRAQQPAIAPRPSPAAIEEIPVIEATIPDLAGTTVPVFFTPNQMAALRRLSDLIMPSSQGLPGALATCAPEFLDFLIGESPHERQEQYRKGLDELNERAHKDYRVSFAQTTQPQADALLAPLRSEWTTDPDQFSDFLRDAKSDILQATENSHEYVRVASKRVRRAGGVGMYWFPIE